jgi:hypothetical protein
MVAAAILMSARPRNELIIALRHREFVGLASLSVPLIERVPPAVSRT